MYVRKTQRMIMSDKSRSFHRIKMSKQPRSFEQGDFLFKRGAESRVSLAESKEAKLVLKRRDEEMGENGGNEARFGAGSYARTLNETRCNFLSNFRSIGLLS
jgi:hypothetical protein